MKFDRGNVVTCRRFSTNGFTLVEILVVVAIIGILASVVLANMSDSRATAKDAVIKAQIDKVYDLAQVYHVKHASYGGSDFVTTVAKADDDSGQCSNLPEYAAYVSTQMDGTMFDEDAHDDTVRLQVREVHIASGGNPASGGFGTRVFCAVGAGAQTWAFAVPLFNPTGSNDGWCVDSTGVSREVDFDMTAPYPGSSNPLLSGTTARCP